MCRLGSVVLRGQYEQHPNSSVSTPTVHAEANRKLGNQRHASHATIVWTGSEINFTIRPYCVLVCGVHMYEMGDPSCEAGQAISTNVTAWPCISVRIISHKPDMHVDDG